MFSCSFNIKLSEINRMNVQRSSRASEVAQMAKNMSATQETRVQCLGWVDPLEKGMATHPSIHAWEIPWTEEPSESRSVISDSFRPHGLYSPWDSPGQNPGVGSLSLLQRIFLTQESNQGLLQCRQILCQLSYEGSPLFSILLSI